MSKIMKQALYAITANEKYLVEDTYNGLYPDDPEQDVDQIPEPIAAPKGGAE